MSVFREREVVCRRCGGRSMQAVALSIHGSRAPAILDEIRHGTFHCFPCDKCQAITIVDGPLVVIDFVRPWFVQLYPRAWVGSWRALERDADRRFEESLGRDAPEMARELATGFVRRVTFGMDALREKLLLRDAGLDDVALETLKLVLGARSDHPLPVLRLVEAGPEQLVLAGDARPILARRDALAQLAADAAFDGTRAQLTAGGFVDAQRITVPGDAPAPPGSVQPKDTRRG